MQRKVGRADGESDMTADQVQVWLVNAGLWRGLRDDVLDIIEAMMQSEHQWMYGGADAVLLVRDAKELLENVHYDRGLIHGDLIRAQNKADFHVDPGSGADLNADMLAVAEDVYERMTLTSKLPGRPDGQVYLRPQGAAIIKIVSQLLAEALGNRQLIEVAREAIKWRKLKEAALDLIPFYKRRKMSPEVLDASVVPEHSAYIRSLTGIAGVDIKPLLKGTRSMAEFTQNMLEASAQGRERLQKYIETVQAATDPVSMDIYIDRVRLPVLIGFLRSRG